MANLYNIPLENGVQLTTQNALLTGNVSTITFTASVTSKLQASATIPGILVIDRVDANGIETPTKTEYISFTGVTGSTVTGLVRGEANTTDQDHAAGAIVELVPDVTWAQGINDVFTTEHAADGTHKISSIKISPEGFLVNGKIVPTVASNNITVAIKTLTNTDPTANNPVGIWIGNELRLITGALSVTSIAGINYFNSGSGELAAKEIDYFVYLGYGTVSNRVFIAYSRLPYGRLQSDFNTTVIQNEKFLDRNEVANATDSIVNIGRFAATLSAGAGHTWSVPAFNSSNLIQRPIFTSRWLEYNSVFSYEAGFGTVDFTSVTVNVARYRVDEFGSFSVYVRLVVVKGSGNRTIVKASLPFIHKYDEQPVSTFQTVYIDSSSRSNLYGGNAYTAITNNVIFYCAFDINIQDGVLAINDEIMID